MRYLESQGKSRHTEGEMLAFTVRPSFRSALESEGDSQAILEEPLAALSRNEAGGPPWMPAAATLRQREAKERARRKHEERS